MPERQLITSAEQILAIDLSPYENLSCYAEDGVDWQLERDRLLFLQTALRPPLECPLDHLLSRITPVFGHSIKPPPEAVVTRLNIQPFNYPDFEVHRHTPDTWAREVDEAWRVERQHYLKQIKEQYTSLIDCGKLKPFKNRRETAVASGLKNADIITEADAYQLAVMRFIADIPWTQLAVDCPPVGGYPKNPASRQAFKRKRADQIRKRVTEILIHLGLAKADLD